jgi:hypothetical protein
MEKHTKRQHIKNNLPYTKYSREEGNKIRIRSRGLILQEYIKTMPTTFNWQRFGADNYLTRSLNQHLPVYCGSGWAHAAVSVIADRIKMIRLLYLSDKDEEFHAEGFYPDVSLSVQFLLNCGGEIAGSCQGGEIFIYLWPLLLLLPLDFYHYYYTTLFNNTHIFISFRFCHWCIPIHQRNWLYTI